jgi:group I intron endonuclease
METGKVYYCYKVTNKINSKAYIGFAADPHTRWRSHKRDAETGRGYALHDAIRKYGLENFEFEVICCGKDKQQMLEYVEPQLIEQHKSLITQSGYNIYRKAGRPKHSNGLKGKHFTEEHRRRISEARKGMKFTEAHRRRLAESHKGQVSWSKGKHLSETTRRKISESLLGTTRAAKQYLVTYPDGRTETIRNMAEFCRQHNLTKGNLCNVAKGRAPHHKGFRCVLQ